jgi:hypothetical protein
MIYIRPVKPSRKIVGYDFTTEERVKKTQETKNTKTETVIRVTTKVMVLECGHLIKMTNFTKAPSIQTECCACAGLES